MKSHDSEPPSKTNPASGSDAAELPDGLLGELRRLARFKFDRLPPGQTLQATALVHEAYLRLALASEEERTPEEFLIHAARAMQDVLVEKARHKASLRAGGAWRRTQDFEFSVPTEAEPHDLINVDESLERLHALYPRHAELVRLRFFAGLSESECAKVLSVSVRTIRRDWSFSRAWLFADLEETQDDQGK